MGLGQAFQKSLSECVSPAGKGGYVLAIFKQSLVISFRITHHPLFFWGGGRIRLRCSVSQTGKKHMNVILGSFSTRITEAWLLK